MADDSEINPHPKHSMDHWAWVHPLRRWTVRGIVASVVFFGLWGVSYRWINPPTTLYMLQENWRLGDVYQEWVDIEDVSPVMVRTLVAAEDANFCLHWGIDSTAIRRAFQEGSIRGGSTISQQTVKNAFLWQGRSWVRKSIEAVMTPYAELIWSKSRMLEIYLNVAEFDEGVFGAAAAAQHYFGVEPNNINLTQAARLASVLPNPKGRSASKPSNFVRKRTRAIMSGAATILTDGRANCFQNG